MKVASAGATSRWARARADRWGGCSGSAGARCACRRARRRATDTTSAPAAGLIHHSDRGCQYTSHAYQAALEADGAVPRMSRKGNCWDNTVAESFFGTLKQEVPFEDPRLSVDDLRAAIGTYIHGYYNTTRLHSSNDCRAPVDHERHFLETAADPVT